MIETLEQKANPELKQKNLVNTTQTSTELNTSTYNFTIRQYPFTQTKQDNLDKDYQSGATIIHIPPSQLPSDVLGMYDPTSHIIYIANNLSSYTETFVKEHESGHALGIRDEARTDAHASKVGYNLRFGDTRLIR